MLSAPNAAFLEESPCCFAGPCAHTHGLFPGSAHGPLCPSVYRRVAHMRGTVRLHLLEKSLLRGHSKQSVSPGRHNPSAGTATEATSHPGQCHEVLRTVAAHPHLQGRQRPFNSGMETGLWDRRVLGGWGRWFSGTGDVASGLHEGTEVTAKGGVCPREAT